MPPDPRKYLWDAANAAELARSFAHGQTFADYQANAMLRAAVERQFRSSARRSTSSPRLPRTSLPQSPTSLQ